MRCRPAKSAAQSLQHLWISDSLLDDAFHRFARVSLAQATHRRHGSNVPGPLEARRRLSRRRMGMTTLERVAGGAPPGEEVGVLFGFGRRRGPPIGAEFAKGWKYQAPYAPVKLAQQTQVRKQDAPGLHWPMFGSDGSPWGVQQEEPQVFVEEDARLTEFLHIPEDISDENHASLDALLDSLAKNEAATTSDIRSIFELLDATLMEAGGHFLIRFIEALSPHDISQQNWRRLASMTQTKIVHRMISRDELLTIFKLILDRTKNWNIVSFQFAKMVAATDAGDSLLEVLEHIVTSDRHVAKTKIWLQCLQSQHESILNGDVHSSSWRRLHGLLAEHFQPSDPHVVHHFGWLKRSELARVLLQFYLPKWMSQAEEKARSRETGYTTAVEAVAKEPNVSQTRSLRVAVEPAQTMTTDYNRTKVFKVFHMSPIAYHSDFAVTTSDPQEAATRDSGYKGRLKYLRTLSDRLLGSQKALAPNYNHYGDKFAILDLVDCLARHKIPYTQLLTEAVDVYMHTQRTTATKNLFMELKLRKHLGIPIALAGRLVHHFDAHNDIDYAFEVLRSVPTLPLLPYAELLHRLVQQGETHGAHIFELLNRFHPEERIPEQWRTHIRLSMNQEHIDLVHDIAYSFASSEHLSPRTAFRRVWECYRFLRDRRAPLQPLISRAFVKAGITRPLKESERLSEAQVKYVISIVHQIEGPAIAKEVDQIVWDAWEWTLERQWSRNAAPPAKGPEGQGRFYKDKRHLWMKGGGRIYSPHAAQEHVNDGAESPHSDANHESGAIVDTESSAGNANATSSQLTTYEPITILSSLTEMNEVLIAFPPEPPPTIETRTTQISHDTNVEDLKIADTPLSTKLTPPFKT